MAGRVRFPMIPASFQDAGEGIRRMYESCKGGACPRSTSPRNNHPPCWEPKYPYQHCSSPTQQNSPPTHQSSPTCPQCSAPTTSTFTTTSHVPLDFGPPPPLLSRPSSAQSKRSCESCQCTNCFCSPHLTLQVFDEPLYPLEKPQSLSPPGWPYCPKRRTTRGTRWDKDWHISERYKHYQDPELQKCGCHKSRIHSGSRTPSPKRSPRAIGIEYHFNRIANEQSRTRTPTPTRIRQRFGRGEIKDTLNTDNNANDQFEGFGHCHPCCHPCQNWSCSPSHVESNSRLESPAISGLKTPSPPFSSNAPVSTRPYTPAEQRSQNPRKQRPQTPRGIEINVGSGNGTSGPHVNSHGHCHTYNAWSCTPSNTNTPKNQSTPGSRDPTPPPAGRMGNGGGITTIKVSYTPHKKDQSTATEDCLHDLNLACLRLGGGDPGEQQANTNLGTNSPATGAPDPRKLFLLHCHCHHSHPLCPTCGHHGNHGPTLFSLSAPPLAPLTTNWYCGCLGAQVHNPHCHNCFHQHHF